MDAKLAGAFLTHKHVHLARELTLRWVADDPGALGSDLTREWPGIANRNSLRMALRDGLGHMASNRTYDALVEVLAVIGWGSLSGEHMLDRGARHGHLLQRWSMADALALAGTGSDVFTTRFVTIRDAMGLTAYDEEVGLPTDAALPLALLCGPGADDTVDLLLASGGRHPAL
jgi:hypothetical protein